MAAHIPTDDDFFNELLGYDTTGSLLKMEHTTIDSDDDECQIIESRLPNAVATNTLKRVRPREIEHNINNNNNNNESIRSLPRDFKRPYRPTAPVASATAASLPSSSSSSSVTKNAFNPSSSSSSSTYPSAPPVPFHAYQAFSVNCIPSMNNAYGLRLNTIFTGNITRALLFDYNFDMEWLLGAVPAITTIPRVDILHGESSTSNQIPIFREISKTFPGFRVYTPHLPIAWGCHHTKMIILVYANVGVRIVIHTANLIDSDWLCRNQGLWAQDFPFRSLSAGSSSSSTPKSPDSRFDFGVSLLDYLSHYRSCGLVIDELKDVDFSAATAILIPSVPGTHPYSAMHKYGHMRVRDILSQELLTEEMKRAPIMAQFSSLGSTTQKWIDEFRTSLASHKTSVATSQSPISSSLHSSSGNIPLKLFWPTVDNVRTSVQGYRAGGCLCCDSKNIKPHILELYHRFDSSISGRTHATPHIKSYCRAVNNRLAWFLLTSANFSQAAWGALQKNATQFMIRHYELGVLFVPARYKVHTPVFSCTPDSPLPLILNPSRKNEEAVKNLPVSFETAPWFESKRYNNGELSSASKSSSIRVIFPIPYNLNAPKYSPSDKPWCWDREYTELDRFGQRFSRLK